MIHDEHQTLLDYWWTVVEGIIGDSKSNHDPEAFYVYGYLDGIRNLSFEHTKKIVRDSLVYSRVATDYELIESLMAAWEMGHMDARGDLAEE